MVEHAERTEARRVVTLQTVDVVMPAHNEGASIADTIREFHQVATAAGSVGVRFIVSEDGSTDDTCAVVREVARDLPVALLTFPERKGYSRAVIDGLEAADADLVCFIDSDGQCDPADLVTLLEALPGNDMVLGYRFPRRDSVFRKVISGAFRQVYEQMFPVRLRDPSCPFLVIRRPALERVMRGHPGLLQQGFWWEFNARAAAAGLTVTEVPVSHRIRSAGTTQVYRINKVPRIAYQHLRALFALRRELRSLAVDPVLDVNA